MSRRVHPIYTIGWTRNPYLPHREKRNRLNKRLPYTDAALLRLGWQWRELGDGRAWRLLQRQAWHSINLVAGLNESITRSQRKAARA